MKHLRAPALLGLLFALAATSACGGSASTTTPDAPVVVHVIDAQGAQVAGLPLLVGSTRVTTDATGTASATVGSDAYDVAFADPTGQTVGAYDGLRGREVTLNAPWRSASQSHATIAVLPRDDGAQIAIVSKSASTQVVATGGVIGAINVLWPSGGGASVHLEAFAFTGGGSVPTTYLATASADFTVADGDLPVWKPTWKPTPAKLPTVAPNVDQAGANEVWTGLAANDAVLPESTRLEKETLAVPVPPLEETLSLVTRAYWQDGHQAQDVLPIAAADSTPAVTWLAPITAVAPDDHATDLGANDVLRSSASGAAYFALVPSPANRDAPLAPTIFIYADGDARIPDLAALGITNASGASYRWSATFSPQRAHVEDWLTRASPSAHVQLTTTAPRMLTLR